MGGYGAPEGVELDLEDDRITATCVVKDANVHITVTGPRFTAPKTEINPKLLRYHAGEQGLLFDTEGGPVTEITITPDALAAVTDPTVRVCPEDNMLNDMDSTREVIERGIADGAWCHGGVLSDSYRVLVKKAGEPPTITLASCAMDVFDAAPLRCNQMTMHMSFSADMFSEDVDLESARDAIYNACFVHHCEFEVETYWLDEERRRAGAMIYYCKE